jgi:chromosome segregation ATPase
LKVIKEFNKETQQLKDQIAELENIGLNEKITVGEYLREMQRLKDTVAELEKENKDYYDRINNLQAYIDNHEEIWKTNTNNSLKRFAEMLKKKIYSLWSGRQLGELLCDIDETLREFVEVE